MDEMRTRNEVHGRGGNFGTDDSDATRSAG